MPLPVQNAIALWVESTGLPVFWANQDAERPQGAYVLLSSTVSPVSSPWVEGSANPNPSPGQEMIHTARLVERLALTIAVFNAQAVAESMLSDLVNALPQYADALRASGWAPATFSDVQNISIAGAAFFEPRCQMTAYGYTSSSATEAGTIVDSAVISGNVI